MQFLRRMEKGAKCSTFCLNHFLETLSVGVSIVMNHYITKLETKQIKNQKRYLFLENKQSVKMLPTLARKRAKKWSFKGFETAKL